MSIPESLSRRAFLGMTAALPFAAASLKAAAKNVPVGVELYSVRGELAKDLPGTITAVGGALTFDAANISVKWSNGTRVFDAMLNKSTGAFVSFTDANWKLRVRAFA